MLLLVLRVQLPPSGLKNIRAVLSCRSIPGVRYQPALQAMMTALLASKAYSLAGEGASALHAMVVLQIFQTKLLQSLEGGAVTPDTVNDLCMATDFVLTATKHTAQAIGRAMGFMVVQQRHLWLNLADLRDADRKVLLNAPITPSQLFGEAVESIIKHFSET